MRCQFRAGGWPVDPVPHRVDDGVENRHDKHGLAELPSRCGIEQAKIYVSELLVPRAVRRN